jgi:hypothetical protein
MPTNKSYHLRELLGLFDVRGMTVEWEAMVMSRFKDGKIAEEWVSADGLGNSCKSAHLNSL